MDRAAWPRRARGRARATTSTSRCRRARGDGAYLAAFEQVVLPALYRFKPELIVVPSGFDASGVDPLGRMMVTSEGYRAMTKLLMKAADDLCGGRLVHVA